jgi:hypothetical protein
MLPRSFDHAFAESDAFFMAVSNSAVSAVKRTRRIPTVALATATLALSELQLIHLGDRLHCASQIRGPLRASDARQHAPQIREPWLPTKGRDVPRHAEVSFRVVDRATLRHDELAIQLA